MATGLVPLEGLQFGIESQAGTLVAADTQLQLEDAGEYLPEIDRVEVAEEHGVLAPTQHIDVRTGTMLRYRHNLDFEQIILLFTCGLKQVATPTGVGPFTWTFDPDPSAPETLDSATFETRVFDGTTAHLQREFGWAHCRRITINLAFNQPATVEAEWFARKFQTSTYTAAQSPLTRELIRSNAFGLWVDSTWAGLGTSQVTGTMRTATLEILPGIAPDFTLDARADGDMTQTAPMKTRARLSMQLEYNASGDAEYDAWEANTRRFIELRATGTSSRSLKLQGAFEYTTPPRFTRDGDLRLVDVEAVAVYDATGGAQLKAEVVNSLGSI